tara:strand:+ start:55303 stop:56718 length:1416 start_codon:yes stop_codon:yes gene_type:complete
MSHTILIVDDKPENLSLLKSILESKGFFVHQAASAKFAISLIKKNIGRYALAIVDFHMPEVNGDQATKMFHEIDPGLQVINITGDDSDETADKCHKAGSFLVLPRLISHIRLVSIVESYCKRFDQKSISHVVSPPKITSDVEKYIATFNMVGVSEQTKNACELIDRYARRPEIVLIVGENGTGKEKIAKAIHEKSKFSSGPFISVNCTAITVGIIESELFGHVKGAFTGAIGAKKGFFKEADGGTIFLDEIGDLPLSVQVKFLRVLQEKEITPVGSSISVKTNVRVISATNADLEKAVKRGTFREDLYYRLNVLPIELAPLRKRTSDIEPLVLHFLNEWKNKTGEKREITQNALSTLLKYSWPGNVRQLENAVTRMLAQYSDEKLDVNHIDKTFLTKKNESNIESYDDALELWSHYKVETFHREREVLEKIVVMSGSMTKASKLIGIAKSTLHDKLKGLGVQINKLWEDEV